MYVPRPCVPVTPGGIGGSPGGEGGGLGFIHGGGLGGTGGGNGMYVSAEVDATMASSTNARISDNPAPDCMVPAATT